MQIEEMETQMQSKMNIIPLPMGSKHLFEQLCTEKKLSDAWLEVRRNRGAPGVDGVTIETFSTKLAEEIKVLKQQLENWTYEPKPVRRVEIPKPDGGKRMLGVPCVRDRVVQTAIKQLLEPILDPIFSANSYGFRPGRSPEQAVQAAQKIVQSGKEYVVDIDLSKFFDRVNHDRLLASLSKMIEDKRIIRLIGNTLRSGIMQEGLVVATMIGTTQGSPLSPLLSNVVLDELDKEIESRGLEHCRFADDSNIFVKTPKAAERVMEKISEFIEKKLKLVVNREKSKVAKSSEVKFLGMTIVNGTLAIANQSMKRAMQRVKELIPRGTSEKIESTIARINKWYTGWSNYYSMTQYPQQLLKIESHIRTRLRCRIVVQQKKRRNLCAKLIKRGVNIGLACTVAYSNMKHWALAQHIAVKRAYPNRWFIEEKKLKIKSNGKCRHWFAINKWVRLP
jgi:group II intron reverse transcriptase/maturase